MNELDQYKVLVKENIQNLINEDKICEAEKLLSEYEKIVKDDVDIYSIRAVMLIIKNQFEEAEKILIKSINNYGEIFDLVYNLAYIYEMKENYQKAYYYYSKSLNQCSNDEIKNEIRDIMNNLPQCNNIQEYMNRKKVLVVAQIFPPMAGSGVQRTLKFVKYLREFNWEPVVVTVDKSSFNYLEDITLEMEIPKNLNIIRIDEKIDFSSSNIENLLNNYIKLVNNENLMREYIDIIKSYGEQNDGQDMMNSLLIPDTSSLWAMDVLNRIDSYVDLNGIDVIYTTSGPYSDHIIGYFLKEKFNIPWVTDFRDEWTNNPYFNFDKENVFFKVMRNMEISILHRADKIITTTPLARENYINIFNVPEDKIITITNGYDEEDFKYITLNTIKADKFKIIHNGILYMVRTPETFLKAIKNLVDKKKIDKNKLSIVFSYTENQEYWKEYLKANRLESIVKLTNYTSHKESINLAMNSDLLLLVVGAGEKNKSIYTGKVFEYLRMGKPILALSPKNSVVDDLLKETNSGENFEFDDIVGMENYILKIYKEWEQNSQKDLGIKDKIVKYERKNLTFSLSSIFNELLNYTIC